MQKVDGSFDGQNWREHLSCPMTAASVVSHARYIRAQLVTQIEWSGIGGAWRASSCVERESKSKIWSLQADRHIKRDLQFGVAKQ